MGDGRDGPVPARRARSSPAGGRCGRGCEMLGRHRRSAAGPRGAVRAVVRASTSGVHFGPTIVGTLWGEPAGGDGDRRHGQPRQPHRAGEQGARHTVPDLRRDARRAGRRRVRIGRSFRCSLPGKEGESTPWSRCSARRIVDRRGVPVSGQAATSAPSVSGRKTVTSASSRHAGPSRAISVEEVEQHDTVVGHEHRLGGPALAPERELDHVALSDGLLGVTHESALRINFVVDVNTDWITNHSVIQRDSR